ncbi:MAG TPA: hypothetical protein VE860_28290 [Chthoniobacterales bacterium]|nr:hypothetical protein [Chthoniobacterales bacterium]
MYRTRKLAVTATQKSQATKEILSGDRLSRPDEQTEIDDEISDQLKEDAGTGISWPRDSPKPSDCL